MDSTVNQVKVKVQPRSGFDKSYMSIGAAKTGQLVPILCDEVLPNSKINLKLAMNVNLPPLANDVYMRCSLKTEAFLSPRVFWLVRFKIGLLVYLIRLIRFRLVYLFVV